VSVASAEPYVRPTFDEIVRSQRDQVRRHAFRLTGNDLDADDLTQETFIRVFRCLDSYTPGTFDGWVYRITQNLFLDMVRRRRKIQFVTLPDGVQDILASTELGPADQYGANHFAPDVHAALAAIPADFRDAVVLRDVDGLTYKEIELSLDVPVTTVRTRIHRGRVLLRASLAHRNRRSVIPADR
jgi:RNA polymerase sigma factor (sigma-70 family)